MNRRWRTTADGVDPARPFERRPDYHCRSIGNVGAPAHDRCRSKRRCTGGSRECDLEPVLQHLGQGGIFGERHVEKDPGQLEWSHGPRASGRKRPDRRFEISALERRHDGISRLCVNARIVLGRIERLETIEHHGRRRNVHNEKLVDQMDLVVGAQHRLG